MKTSEFQPKHHTKLFFGFVAIIFFAIFTLWRLIFLGDISFENLFMVILFCSLTLLTPNAFIKRIVFASDSFTIEKYLLPRKTFYYSDVTDIGETAIKIKKGGISLNSMSNSDELKQIFNDLISQGKVNRYQIENKLVNQEKLAVKSAFPAGVIAFVLWSATYFIWPYEDSFARGISFLGFWIPAYLVVYQILKRRAE